MLSRLCGRLRIHKRRYAFFDVAGANAIPVVQMYFPKLLIVCFILNFVLLALAVWHGIMIELI
jgi:hypothetical protein